MTKISVAMATFNGSRYLRHQLDSIAAQTLKPNELIISDDCSSDSTVQIIEKFSRDAPFKVVLISRKYNKGYAQNFSDALMHTCGDLVFLCDQDDVWFPDKIQIITSLSNSCDRGLVFMNDALMTDSELQSFGISKLEQIRSTGLANSCFVMGCCMAVKRELLELCLPIPRDMNSHDDWLAGIADGLNRKIITNQILQYYRRHDSNTSQSIVNSTNIDPLIQRYLKNIMDWCSYLTSRLSQSSNHNPATSIFGTVPLFKDWIDKTKRDYPLFCAGDMNLFSTNVEAKLLTLTRRQEVRTSSFPLRLIRIYLLWRKGGYLIYAGFRSALADLFS